MYLCRSRLKKLGVLMNALADQKHEAEQNFHGGAPRSAVPDEEVDIGQN